LWWHTDTPHTVDRTVRHQAGTEWELPLPEQHILPAAGNARSRAPYNPSVRVRRHCVTSTTQTTPLCCPAPRGIALVHNCSWSHAHPHPHHLLAHAIVCKRAIPPGRLSCDATRQLWRAHASGPSFADHVDCSAYPDGRRAEVARHRSLHTSRMALMERIGRSRSAQTPACATRR